MTLQLAISYVFYGMAFISILCFITLCLLYWRRERNERGRLQKARNYLKNIKPLYETMRDMLEEQRRLAQQFNEDLDKKMQVVKGILEQSLGRNEDLYERQRLLTQELDMAAAKIKDIKGQLSELTDLINAESVPNSSKTKRPPKDAEKDAVPETPANAEKARDAFRTLLEMKRSEENSAAFPAEARSETTNVASGASHCEDDNKTLSLRQQIEECHASGMSVLEIAEKMNLSRGEVRLMLSLKD